MDYNLEALGDERFQKLCQALLTASFPNVQCLPVGQPDGGRDAFERQASGFVVFQVKFTKDPSNKDPRTVVAEFIRSEKEKVDALIARGATTYYFLTNVPGTAYPESGSIDKLNLHLNTTFGIPSYCWWRDDIERRIESTNGLIWRYPEMFKGSDFLEILTSGSTFHIAVATCNTFRAYVASQYSRESEVRFQQVQIQNSLLELFTDTPVGLVRETVPSPELCNLPEGHLQRMAWARRTSRYRNAYEHASETLAADWLLAVAPEKGLQRIVLEGAPGQGKSTVTQYLAQIHRMRTLGKTHDIAAVPQKHLAGTLRLPLRVDLRDYAAWLNGNDPFASGKVVPRPATCSDGLESFLSYQIRSLSGGREFVATDLAATLSQSHCLLVLDGFDEVADKATRGRLIEQIREGSERLGKDCLSLQVIVTSRPAAFILSPGFSEREWLHVSLFPMQKRQIERYTDKWIAARKIPLEEGQQFKALLLDRVNRSHVKSLAQNPMQLAILLTLISTRGISLPDKRTALYDSYIDLFFGREAEKDALVRENRDLLIQLHRYIAWILQSDAEKPGGTGSISQPDLEILVQTYLKKHGHEGDVLKLFTGAVERVGALVSRVQGMLEFEVQPLREYFTGRYLYETAPYSPAGAEKKGTRPQRFQELARRPYWLNVARFYAGCYSSGELSSLVSGLEQLHDGASLAVRSHLLQLALLFLDDWVFAQEPKTVREVVEFLTSENNLRLLVASRASWQEDRLALPEKSGRRDLAAKARARFLLTSEPSYLRRLGLLLRLNQDKNDRWRVWREVRAKGEPGLLHASCLGLFLDATGSGLRELVETYGEDARDALIAFGRWDALDPPDRIAALNLAAVRPPAVFEPGQSLGKCDKDIDLYRVYMMLKPYIYAPLSFDKDDAMPFEKAMIRYAIYLPAHSNQNAAPETETKLFDVAATATRVSRSTLGRWRTNLEPWSDFVESVRRTWGEGARVYCLAAIAAGIVPKDAGSAMFDKLLDDRLPLVERAHYARHKQTATWWKQVLDDAGAKNKEIFVLLLILSWASSSLIKTSMLILSEMLQRLDPERWDKLVRAVQVVINATISIRKPLNGFHESDLQSSLSPRLRALLTLRLPSRLALRALMELSDGFDGEDRSLGVFLAARLISQADSETTTWRKLISFLRRYELGLLESDIGYASGQEIVHYGPYLTMPASVAEEVATDQEKLPLTILEFAELSLSRQARGRSTPLGGVAKTDGWLV